MNDKTRVVVYGALTVLGAALVLAGVLGYLGDELPIVGGALVTLSVVRLIQVARRAYDPEYARMDAVRNSDERFAFLAGKSADLAFRISVIGLAILSVVLRPFGYPEAANTLGLAMSAEVAVYWACYLVMKNRY